MCSQNTILGAGEREKEWILGNNLGRYISRNFDMITETMLYREQQGEITGGSLEGGVVGDAGHGESGAEACAGDLDIVVLGK
jgi:hypothetical protein